MLTLSERILEANSLWYKYKTTVWLEKSAQTAVVHNVMRVLRAVRNSGDLAYVSLPITTGRYFYNSQLEAPNAMSYEEILRNAINYNYQVGWDFVKALSKRRSCPIVYPADLIPIHQQWEQAHFQALWFSIIAEKCTEVHMGEGWEFSNGGSEEFTHVMQLRLGLPTHHDLNFFNTKENEKVERERMRNIKVYDHRGDLLTLEQGIQAIDQSRLWLRTHKFKSDVLDRSAEALRWTREMIQRGFYQ